MVNEVKFHPVYKSVNKPLTILGTERRLFFVAVMIGGATFNFFGSLVGGLCMFALLYCLARWTTATDPQFLRILLNSPKYRRQYDPGKLTYLAVERISHGEAKPSS